MLARKSLSPKFVEWNATWGAPFGKKAMTSSRKLFGRNAKEDEFDKKGIFGFQGNNDTRSFEYPWAYHIADLKGSSKILEIGGGRSGFQFVLALSGARVVNVDPGMDDIGGRVTKKFIDDANRKLNTDVTLVSDPIANAELQNATFDVAYSISVIEHIHPSELALSMKRIGELLRTGGRLVLTVDLFLDLEPFSRKTSNRFGTNVSIAELERVSGLKLDFGNRAELYGYNEFDRDRVMEILPELFIGTGYPTLIQCVTFSKL